MTYLRLDFIEIKCHAPFYLESLNSIWTNPDIYYVPGSMPLEMRLTKNKR